jgi:hypothetical protein
MTLVLGKCFKILLSFSPFLTLYVHRLLTIELDSVKLGPML